MLISLKTRIASFSIAAALAFATSSIAATELDGVTMRDIQILGSTYDVVFHDGPFDTVFPTGKLTFATQSEASEAVMAIISATAYRAIYPMDSNFTGFVVPFALDETMISGEFGGGFSFPASGRWRRSVDYGQQYTWAQFSLSAVPEPATWAMMIIGFGVVGSTVRASRRRTALSAA